MALKWAFFYSNNMKENQKKLGILGGGQLARMMIPTLKKWDISFSILDQANCVSAPFCSNIIIGDYNNFDDVSRLMKSNEVVTFDLEAISLSGIKKLKEVGIKISPPVSVIEVIQDKGKQKQFFKDHNFPTSDFKLIEKGSADLDAGFIKLRHGGYDGKGVFLWSKKDEFPEAFKRPVVWEEKIEVKKEISVLVARNANGEMKIYEPVEMVFNHELNLIDYTLSPSSLSKLQKEQARSIASQIASTIKSEGILAVELFLTSDDKILINELAPRPHNSGHHTIESTSSSQFENHVRGVLNYPLGETKQLRNYSLTFNLLGKNKSGEAIVTGVDEILKYKDVHLHLYGKKESRLGRKMGHVTLLADDLKSIMELYLIVRDIITIEGK